MEVLFMDTCSWSGVRCLLLMSMFLLKAAADCPNPKGGENIVLSNEALLMNEFPDGIQVTLQCANGYVKENGSDFITCIDGKWSEPDLTCKKKDCGPPEPQPNMRFDISGGTLFGDAIKAICDKGYQIKGPSYKTCYAKGWTGKPRCEFVICEKPAEVANGRNSWNSQVYPKYEESIHYSCNEGYTLVGKATITCSETGKYDSEPPECEAVMCEKPAEVANGRNSWNSQVYPEYGESIHYSCNEGYTLVGKATITCSETGKYDSEPPECEEPSPSTDLSATPAAHRDETTSTTTVSTSARAVLLFIGVATEDITTNKITHSTPTPSVQGGRDMTAENKDENDKPVDDNNKDMGHIAVIVSVMCVSVVVPIMVGFLYSFLLKRKGSTIGTVSI